MTRSTANIKARTPPFVSLGPAEIALDWQRCSGKAETVTMVSGIGPQNHNLVSLRLCVPLALVKS